MSKLHNMRGIEINKFRAVSSGSKTLNELFGENGFVLWVEQHRNLLMRHMYEPTDFLWHEGKNIIAQQQIYLPLKLRSKKGDKYHE